MTIPNKYSVKQIMSYECREWFLKKHYAKRLPSISYAFGLYKNKNNLLIGVCSYGRPMSSTLINGSFNGLYQDNFMELKNGLWAKELKFVGDVTVMIEDDIELIFANSSFCNFVSA